jgi:hypothetical protein
LSKNYFYTLKKIEKFHPRRLKGVSLLAGLMKKVITLKKLRWPESDLKLIASKCWVSQLYSHKQINCGNTWMRLKVHSFLVEPPSDHKDRCDIDCRVLRTWTNYPINYAQTPNPWDLWLKAVSVWWFGT